MTADRVRIALLTINYWPEPTGVARYTTGLAEGMAARGMDVRVLTGLPHYPMWIADESYPSSSMRAGVDVRRVKHQVPALPSPLQRARMELDFGRRLVRSSWSDRDVVICTSPPLLSASLVAARMRVGRLSRRRQPAFGAWVQDLYGRAVLETDAFAGAPARLVGVLEGLTLRSADRVAVIHEGFGTHVERSLGVATEDIDVIRNWTHIDPRRPGPDSRLSIRHELGWRDDDIVILHAGNMGAKQGLRNVVDAARIADDQEAPLHFVLLGNGHERAELRRRAGGIRRLDWLDSVPDDSFLDTLSAADVLLVNEKPGVGSMSLPSKLTSYFASATPVLAATDEGSLTARELMRSGAGIRIPAGDPQALVAAALDLGANASMSRTLVDAGLRYSERELSKEYALDEFALWIERLHHTAQRWR